MDETTVQELAEWDSLNERQQKQAEDTAELAVQYGMFDQGTGANGAHYAPADKNPFKAEGLACKNCIFYDEINKQCQVVVGTINPDDVCKLWIIPESVLNNPTQEGKPVTVNAQIESGTLYANAEQRIVSGLLLPYGEIGNTNLGKFSIAQGAVEIPADPDVVTLNVQHDNETPVGRATELLDTEAGIVATFKVANTPDGDQLLKEIADGTRSKLSAEVKNVVIRARQAVSGSLFGAAVVTEGAFPSAALMAEYAEDTLVAEVLEALPSPDGASEEIVVDAVPEKVIVDVVNPDDGSVEQTVFVPENPTNTEGDTPMGAATAPATIQAAKASEGVTLTAAIDRFASAARTGESFKAALADITYDGVGAAGNAINLPQWLGELWEGRTYDRRYIPLISSGSLNSMKVVGWQWADGGKPEVAMWSGNKTDVPSNTVETEIVETFAQRYAGAHDIAREFRDFGTPEFWDAYFRAMVRSYTVQTDNATIDALSDNAPVHIASGAGAWDRILDGVDAIIYDAVPTFAVVAKDIYRSLITTPAMDGLAYLNASLGLESGSLAGFQIVPSARLNAGEVIVGAREAATSYELPGSPLRVEAENISKGGVDVGLFGYHAVAFNNLKGLAKIVTTD